MPPQDDRSGCTPACGIVAVLGSLLAAYGVTGLAFGSSDFSTAFPGGELRGEKWLGITANGWTNVLFVAGGMVLVASARSHWYASRAAAATTLVFLTAAVIAVADRDDVLGLLAVGDFTALVWGVAVLLLLVAASLPPPGAYAIDTAERRRTSPADGRLERRGRRAVERSSTPRGHHSRSR